MSLGRSASLPQDDGTLIHAASMPLSYDTEAKRPCCGGMCRTSQFFGAVLAGVVFVILKFVALEYSKANEMLAVTVLVAVFWSFEVLPIYITALLPAVLMPMYAIAPIETIANKYFTWIHLLFLGSFIVNCAVELSGLPRRIALLVLMRTRSSPARMLMGFMGISWVMSMCCSTLTTTLMVAPIAVGLMQEAEEEAMDQAEQSTESDESSNSGEQRPKSKQVRRFADGLLLGVAYGSLAGGIATIIGSPANAFLMARPILNEQIMFLNWIAFALPTSFVALLAGYGVLYLRYVRSADVLLSRTFMREEYERVGKMSRDEILSGLVLVLMLVLWVLRPLTFGKLVTFANGQQSLNDSVMSAACGILVFVIPSDVRPGEALLPWRHMQERLEWGALLLMGGAFAISEGWVDAGLDVMVGKHVGEALTGMPVFLQTFVIVAVTSVFTQIMGGISFAAISLVVLSSTSLQQLVNPMTLLLPATVANSFAFSIPTATPPLAVVFAKSMDLTKPLTFSAFSKAGIPLNILMAILGTFTCYVMAGLVFHATDPFPEYACIPGECMWFPIPTGNTSVFQGCIVQDSSDGLYCKIANGSLVDTSQYEEYM
mmetsp:Transcript_112857/g.350319  ORF Transcript_112857/g.350319 Transcript_112857/m.350319 type:complete len:601 (+) Transcript_112857:77-1879(+)